MNPDWDDLSDEELIARLRQKGAPAWWVRMAVASYRSAPEEGWGDDIEEVLSR